MKQLTLELQKRLLIVEYETAGQTLSALEIFKNGSNLNYPEKLKLICKGSELTEEIAGELVPEEMHSHIKDKEAVWYEVFFISSIEAQGYYWGENPIYFDDDEFDFGKRYEMRINWEKAESITFNPEKTLIFEIL